MINKRLNSNNNLVQSLVAGLRVLECVASEQRSVSLATITRKLAWEKNKVWRLLRTLHHEGYLEYDPLERTYTMGGKSLQLYLGFQETLRRESRFPHEFLEELAEKTEKDAFVTVLRGDKVIVVDVAVSRRTTSVRLHVGVMVPAFCVAAGKVLLAEMSTKNVLEVLEHSDIHAFTPRTKTDRKEILKELRHIHVQGWASEEGEFMPDVASVAAPVRDAMRVLGSVGVLVPLSEITEKEIADLAEQVQQIARKMENNLAGWSLSRLPMPARTTR